MTSKQRAYLKKESNALDPVYLVGKNGIEESILRGISEVLKARELIKISVHETSEYTAKETAKVVVEKLDAEVVQVMGRRIVMYKRNPEINRYGVE